MQKRFDSYLAKGKETGYITYKQFANGKKEEKKSYESYMTNKQFQKLVDEMKNSFPDAYEAYSRGSGAELEERINSKKSEIIDTYPPKMASYGSSSLMTYLKLRNLKDFKYEYKLDTTFSKRAPANLDGYIETDREYIFVESKCREIYGAGHYPFVRSKAYFKLYNEYISKLFKTEISERGNEIKVGISLENGTKIEYFEISQMICHFLGIGKSLEGRQPDKKIKFIYFLFSPMEAEICDTQILERYKCTVREINSIDFVALFEMVLEFLRCERKINIDTGWDFSFKLCHQNDVLGEIL